jgi:hypothetical protein
MNFAFRIGQNAEEDRQCLQLTSSANSSAGKKGVEFLVHTRVADKNVRAPSFLNGMAGKLSAVPILSLPHPIR